MKFNDIFSSPKPLIACIHLMPLPGSPRYSGKIEEIYDTALAEVETYSKYPIDGFIIENFRDVPFYPDKLPAETIAALTVVTREIVKVTNLPVGVNALRNDAHSAIAVATATRAHFVRVNVHMGAVVSDQGIIQGKAHQSLRLRAALKSNVLIFADAGVKHAAELGARGLEAEVRDLTERGLADAIIVSGQGTGLETKTEDVDIVRQNTSLPIIIGSGTTPENLDKMYSKVDGVIVGSYFKKEGNADNFPDEERIKTFIKKFESLKN